MTNALLTAWEGEFALPPFAQIKDEDFAPAFDAALTEARDNIALIVAQPEVTFANTIEAMELADLVVVMSMGRIEQVGRPQDIRARPASAFVRDFIGA